MDHSICVHMHFVKILGGDFLISPMGVLLTVQPALSKSLILP